MEQPGGVLDKEVMGGEIKVNLLEQYIKEIHSVEEVKKPWGNYIKVDLTKECYGRTDRVMTSFMDMEEWESIKAKGYYMG